MCAVIALLTSVRQCLHVLLFVLQVAYHASRALLQYVRAHLVSHMAALQRRLRDGAAATAAVPQPHKPLNTSAAAVDELIGALATDAKLAEAFVRTR